EGVGSERGARRAGLFAPDLLAVGLQNLLALDTERLDLLLGEAVGHEDVAVAVESLELVGGKLHGAMLPGRQRSTSGGVRSFLTTNARLIRFVGTPPSPW